MISKHVIGRLGNQMFQYAAVRAFQLKYRKKDDILLDFSEVYSRDSEGYKEEITDLNISNVKIGRIKLNAGQKLSLLYLNVIKFINLKLDPKNYSKKMYLIENKIQSRLNKKGLYSFRLGYYDFKDCNKSNLAFYGTFESSEYFNDIKEELKKEFTPKYGVLEKNKNLYEKINNTESVCVTIRRGDFVNNEDVRKNLYICTPEYFTEAIKIMKKKVPNASFFVFSDDVEWCKENMDFPENTMFESGEDPVWEKLRLMYSCKHFIISNSTFSWWVQYLSRNEEKVVIAPSRWTNDSYKSDDKIDIYEDDWLLIDIDNLKRGEK